MVRADALQAQPCRHCETLNQLESKDFMKRLIGMFKM
jgi:hypothetical protein